MDHSPHYILEPGGTEVRTRVGGAHRYQKPLKYFRLREILNLSAESFSAWSRHKDSRLGASLAFYTLLSLTPILLVAFSIGGLVFGKSAAENGMMRQVQDLIGPQGAAGIQALLAGTHHTGQGIIATVLGLITLLLGASGALLELRDALNTIWEVPQPQTTNLGSILLIIKQRLFSFALVLAIGFLLLVSLVVNAWLAAAGAFFAGFLPAPEIVLHVADAVVSFAVITALFAAIYRIMPDVHLEWRDVWFGSAITSLLFTVGKFLIGIYLGRASFASTYGAAASVVVVIAWVYYSGQVFFLGAEFTKIFTTRYGSHLHHPGHPPDGQGLITTART